MMQTPGALPEKRFTASSDLSGRMADDLDLRTSMALWWGGGRILLVVVCDGGDFRPTFMFTWRERERTTALIVWPRLKFDI